MNKGGFSYDGHRLISCDALSETGLVRHGFSTRKDGTSSGNFSSLNLGIHISDKQENVRQNFILFCRDVGVEPKQTVFARQVHSTLVLPVTKQDAGKGIVLPGNLPEADGVVTNEPGVCLTTFYADCTPILLLDPVCSVIAAVHSGWRGTIGKIICEAICLMQKQYGSESRNIIAATGPSIKQCHFEVDEDVYLQFVETFGEIAQKSTVSKGQKYYIDTDSLHAHLLLSMGVLAQNIHTCKSCTYCDDSLFFSHRREGITGRMAAMIELK